jgi:hypothetical protein
MSTSRAFVGMALLAATAAHAVGAQSSSSASSSSSTATGEADTLFNIARNGVIDITLRTGRLIVRGFDRTNAELRAKGSDYQLRSAGVSVTLAVAEAGTRRGNTRGAATRRSDEPDIELLVPRGVRLIINGHSADVGVFDVAGDVEVHLQTGDVRLESLGGRAIVETISGDVSVGGGVQDLRITTTSGDVVARGVRGSVEAHTTSGTISIAAEQATRVQVDAVNGDIDFEGTLAADARLQFATHSGDVVLRLPTSTRGELEVSTFTGDVRGVPMTLLPSRTALVRATDRSTRHFELGGGGSVRITIATFSGDVSIRNELRRRPD